MIHFRTPFSLVLGVVLVCALSPARAAAIQPGLRLRSSISKSGRGAKLPLAKVGVYYFDGWAMRHDPWHHLHGLADNPQFAGREPLSGWLDNTQQSIQQQLAWAHQDGISFFVFDWYYHASGPPLSINNALRLYKKLRRHSRVYYALLYVNGGKYKIPSQSWHHVVTQWTTRYFKNPNYQRIDGRPILAIINIAGFARQMTGYQGSQGRVQSANRALAVLQAVARAHGLPGVYVIGGGVTYPSPQFQHLSWLRSVHIQAMTLYNYPGVLALSNGPMSYRRLIRAGQRIWMRFAVNSHHSFFPLVMDGWDPRPWNEHVFGKLFWFRRSPEEFEQFVKDAIIWAKNHPRMRVSPPPHRPLLLIEAWNELGEGSYMLPTVGDHNAYGRALARALGLTPP